MKHIKTFENFLNEANSGIDNDIKKLETLIRKQFNVVEFKAPSKRPLIHEEFLMVKVKDDKYGGPQTGLGKFIKRWSGVEPTFVDNYGNDKVYWVSLEKIENGPGVHESIDNEDLNEAVKKEGSGDKARYKLGNIKVSGYKLIPIMYKNAAGDWQISIEVADSRGFYKGPIEIKDISSDTKEVLRGSIENKSNTTIDTTKLADLLNDIIKTIQFD
jgi:hypothetical protein